MVEWGRLRSVINTFHPNGLVDRWRCELGMGDEFSVAAVRRRIDGASNNNVGTMTRWVKQVPIKVNTFIWRASPGRIPSAQSLISKGIRLEYSIYSYCKVESECVQNMLLLNVL
ncbi:hypothetical protein L1887_11535 [Cichorium endivia]|nr:hypothetical protein L1887_11535 [Cichorium endivia]